jgi:hypothetical protein
MAGDTLVTGIRESNMEKVSTQMLRERKGMENGSTERE